MNVDVEQQVQQMFRDRAAGVTAGQDPWGRFVARERRNRARRHRLQAGVAVAALAFGGATVAGASAGLVPVPSTMLVDAAGEAAATSRLWSEPPRGSLARDDAWMAGMRRVVEDARREGRVTVVDPPTGIRVLFAERVPGGTVALAGVRLRRGLTEVTTFEWYTGPAGASPDDLSLSAEGEQGEVLVDGTGSEEGDGYLAVVAPSGAQIEVSLGIEYGADGRIARRWTSHGSGGVAVLRLAPAAVMPPVTVRARLDGELLRPVGPSVRSWTTRLVGGDAPGAWEALVTEAVRDGGWGVLDRDLATTFVQESFEHASLVPGRVGVSLRSGLVGGHPCGLVVLAPEGGGRLVFAYRVLEPGTDTEPRVTVTELRLLAPARGAASRPFAWRLRAGGGDAVSPGIGVAAPPGAQRVELVVDGVATPVTVDAAGFGTGSAPLTASSVVVRAYAADGILLGETPVPGQERDLSAVPGSDRVTRLVD